MRNENPNEVHPHLGFLGSLEGMQQFSLNQDMDHIGVDGDGRVPEHRLIYELFNNDAVAHNHKNTVESVPVHL